MFSKEQLEKMIQEEEQKWETISKQIQEQFTLEQGASLGRIKLLKDMIETLEGKADVTKQNE